MLRVGRKSYAGILAVSAILLLMLTSSDADAENRLYYLRVTLRDGGRYETLSASDPINYCHAHGGSVIYMNDYSLIFSPEMRIRVIRTWIDTSENLPYRWRDVLRANKMLANRNHKPLPRVERLSLFEVMQPEEKLPDAQAMGDAVRR